ncbi:MAG TPA: WD40 repeat domain-containing protein [Acidimicrobiales bacterium]|nr:WD40 repeat domain-containing protein [Acidimicrobiales bacterium]
MNRSIKPFVEFGTGATAILAFLTPTVVVLWNITPFRDRGSDPRVETVPSTPSSSGVPQTYNYPSTVAAPKSFGVEPGTQTCAGPGGSISALAYSKEGVIAVGTEDGNVSFFDGECRGARVQLRLFGHVSALTFDEAGNRVYVGTYEKDGDRRRGYIRAYGLGGSSRPEAESAAVDGDVNSIELSSDGETVYSTGNGVRRWTRELQPIAAGGGSLSAIGIDDPHVADLAVARYPTGTEAVFALGTLGKLYKVDTETWQAQALVTGCGTSAYSLAATQRHLFVVGANCIYALDHSGEKANDIFNFRFPVGFSALTVAAVDAAHETVVLAGQRDEGPNRLYLLDPTTGNGGAIETGARGPIFNVALRSDGRAVAADEEGAVRIWTVRNA